MHPPAGYYLVRNWIIAYELKVNMALLLQPHDFLLVCMLCLLAFGIVLQYQLPCNLSPVYTVTLNRFQSGFNLV